MARAILLNCPVCEARRALAGDRDDHAKESLLAAAASHLDGHGLDESARAIRKHAIAAGAEERILDEATLADLPTEGWERGATA